MVAGTVVTGFVVVRVEVVVVLCPEKQVLSHMLDDHTKTSCCNESRHPPTTKACLHMHCRDLIFYDGTRVEEMKSIFYG